ncbi:hypothetical protein EXIGLDRAFT_648058 [Exidia glandulosa HHB12029]|uniref:Cytoplasmic protein n=1 Tax=Exidia glandulosa HHB12029 TaxID=1314781 RepID=A0A166AG91_EXIGL|nr:hypothetical protein EXIGLDRAFT_648058 [Exidia glandulosa HHB12029]
MADPTTNTLHPLTDATLTVRVIKSFTYRTERSVVLHHVDLTTTTVAGLKRAVLDVVATQSGWKPYRTVKFDTLKLYTKAHGNKTQNLIINLDHDDWIFEDDDAILQTLGLENESEVSFFNRELYEEFKKNPEVKWD